MMGLKFIKSSLHTCVDMWWCVNLYVQYDGSHNSNFVKTEISAIKISMKLTFLVKV